MATTRKLTLPWPKWGQFPNGTTTVVAVTASVFTSEISTSQARVQKCREGSYLIILKRRKSKWDVSSKQLYLQYYPTYLFFQCASPRVILSMSIVWIVLIWSSLLEWKSSTKLWLSGLECFSSTCRSLRNQWQQSKYLLKVCAIDKRECKKFR